MTPTRVRAVLFDLDGVLIDSYDAWFHVVNAGRCWLEVDGEAPRELHPGDFALVPHGQGHLLRSEPGAPTARVERLEYAYTSDRYAILHHGGGGMPTSIVCGTVRFGHPAARNLVALLPRTIVVEGSPGSPSPEMSPAIIAASRRDVLPCGCSGSFPEWS